MTHVSVIVSTFERPGYLERALHGYALQTDRNFEIVVADDGSTRETAAVISAARMKSGLPITHVWHAHNGFRKSLILNRAIVASRSDYLLFTDGDCIPRVDLIQTHRELARPGHYIAGGYLKLPPGLSAEIQFADIDAGRVTDLSWLKSRGWRPGRRALRLVGSRRLAVLFDAVTPTAADFQGNNTSAWRDDILAVNGFECEMGYGGLDQALGFRLQNAGVKGIQARYRAIMMHLHHDRPYRDARIVRRNREIMARIRRDGETRARIGIDELEPDPSLHVDGVPVYHSGSSLLAAAAKSG